MTTLEAALTAWIAFHAQLGVDIESYLLPPATEDEVAEVEAEIGFELSDDLVELYLTANGQVNTYRSNDLQTLNDSFSDSPWAPLFGNFEFLPLSQALAEYNFWLNSYEDERRFAEKYSLANPERPYEAVQWEVREGDPVGPEGWKPGWFPFARANADFYYVDLAPPRGGSLGQVVVHGADEYILKVLAPSISDLMETAAAQLSVDDEERFEWAEPNSYMPVKSVYFNMDWRWEPVVAQKEPDLSQLMPKYHAWIEQQNERQEQELDSYKNWLEQQAALNVIELDQIDGIVVWTGHSLINRHNAQPPQEIMQELIDYQQSIGESVTPLDSNTISQELKHSSQATSNDVAHSGYLMQLASAQLSGQYMAGFMMTITADDAIGLYHDYQAHTGNWDPTTRKRVDEFSRKINAFEQKEQLFDKSPDDESDLVPSGFSNSMITTSASFDSVTVCRRRLDTEAFTKDETCYTVEY